MTFDERLATRLRLMTVGEAGLSEKRMFGGLGFLIDGNMAVSASGEGGLLLRVPAEATTELLARPGASPCVMRGRELTGWIRVDVDDDVTDEELGYWVRIGVACARSFPPK